MREIKFMAWNKKYKTMTVEPFSFDGFDGGCFYDYSSRPSGSPLWYAEDMDILQFTGVKDKNGKEIYEGDIAKVGTEIDNPTEILLVEWDKKECHYRTTDPNKVMGWRPPISNRSHLFFEVIGNIYENPELLTK